MDVNNRLELLKGASNLLKKYGECLTKEDCDTIAKGIDMVVEDMETQIKEREEFLIEFAFDPKPVKQTPVKLECREKKYVTRGHKILEI